MLSHTIFIWIVVLAAVLVVLCITALAPSGSAAMSPTLGNLVHESWVARLAINLLGYATVLVPGYIIKRFVQKVNYMDSAGKGMTRSVVSSCFYGNEVDKLSAADSQRDHKEKSALRSGATVLFCFIGLQGSYLTWGLLQEKIMTKDYVSPAGGVERFKDSQFLVFVNRILAFLLSGAYVLLAPQPPHRAPLYKYSFCSFSNIMSSWCQYEALKYVSFPTQVMAKASKIIPVMLMGKVVSRKSYEFYEYVCAVVISVGMTLFMLGSEDGHHPAALTTFSGAVILAAYMAFDSFTSNWQSELFGQYRMTSMQMMCGVNLFSCLLTVVSLLQQGSFLDSLYFMVEHPAFPLDILVLSLTSASGQLFIFYTISQFGAIVFVIMMTIRQGLAILLSCILYHHAISPTGVLGVVLVFVSIFLRIYCGQRLKQIRKRQRQSKSLENPV